MIGLVNILGSFNGKVVSADVFGCSATLNIALAMWLLSETSPVEQLEGGRSALSAPWKLGSRH